MGLADLFFRQSGKAVDKWEQYLRIYEQELWPFRQRGKPIDLLEIGVQNGGSLELWSSYLPAGSRIIGLDVDPNVSKLSFDGDITVHSLNACDPTAVSAVLGKRQFDVIIDDGSHHASDITASFSFLFDRLKPRGCYIIEDLHAGYYPSHGGGFRTPGSPIEWLKGFVDALNADYISPVETISREHRMEFERFNRELARVTFYDSVAVLEKLAKPKVAPYRRIYSGVRADVEPERTWLGALPVSMLRSTLLGAATVAPISQSLLDIVEELRAENGRLQEELKLRPAPPEPAATPADEPPRAKSSRVRGAKQGTGADAPTATPRRTAASAKPATEERAQSAKRLAKAPAGLSAGAAPVTPPKSTSKAAKRAAAKPRAVVDRPKKPR